MFTLKLRKIGKSLALILPKEMLAHFRAKEGQTIFAMKTPTGYTLTTLDPQGQQQVSAGEAFMDRYSEVFAPLAK